MEGLLAHARYTRRSTGVGVIKPKIEPQPKAPKAAPDQAAGAASTNLNLTKSKMGDDGGYESCPDMTNSQLARAANT
ncbi:hypothetical protein Y032_0004g1735 [Ancylostoma ceylanicum]|uniref:Uncharacterized protein n=1 Tax=Ancylostoma ceylanicum TaxID=53326 RepID=A0A016VVD6_9BILA|nr:hypothetical protein Y032_0004g1735 [Ancylostoma ceylanicum]